MSETAGDSRPLVGIIMGSDSDLPVMKAAAEVLEELEISYEVKISSAHRTPGSSHEFAVTAVERGLAVVIAGAGGAAHLPGVIAASTPLPVIGVPVKAISLSGLDSLLSIAQMPPGVPVATVGVNAARNAGILAAQIIGAVDVDVRKRVIAFKERLRAGVEAKAAKLEAKGWRAYLEG